MVTTRKMAVRVSGNETGCDTIASAATAGSALIGSDAIVKFLSGLKNFARASARLAQVKFAGRQLTILTGETSTWAEVPFEARDFRRSLCVGGKATGPVGDFAGTRPSGYNAKECI
jgi:hypothetical protein